jgi:hypothetical protein
VGDPLPRPSAWTVFIDLCHRRTLVHRDIHVSVDCDRCYLPLPRNLCSAALPACLRANRVAVLPCGRGRGRWPAMRPRHRGGCRGYGDRRPRPSGRATAPALRGPPFLGGLRNAPGAAGFRRPTETGNWLRRGSNSACCASPGRRESTHVANAMRICGWQCAAPRITSRFQVRGWGGYR